MTVGHERRPRDVRAVAFAACSSLSLLAGTAHPAKAQGSVGVSLHMDAESAELIRAWRRSQGLDPPDPAADARLAERLRLRRAAQQPRTTVADDSPHRREQR